MVQVSFTVSVSKIRGIYPMPRKWEITEDQTIVDLIHKADQEYREALSPERKKKPEYFLNQDCHSLLQLLWNPDTEKFYEDVGIEARNEEVSEFTFPVEKDWKTPINKNAWIVIMPDAGC